jgi:cytochrome c
VKALLLAAAALAGAIGTAQAQDLAAGEQSFRKCFACHRVGPEARHLVGPSLNGLEGRKSGTMEGYNYSEANKKAEIVWSDESFREYIQNPLARVPGTKMGFVGIKDPKEIADLWAYLKQFKADGSKK